MKNRAAFLLTLCLYSTLSFADSIIDAPLVVSDPYATDAQPVRNNAIKGHGDKKEKKCPPQTAQSKDKTQQQERKPSQQKPSQTDMQPTM